MSESEVYRCRRPSGVLARATSTLRWANDDDVSTASSRTAGLCMGVVLALLDNEHLALTFAVKHAQMVRSAVQSRTMGYDEAMLSQLIELENQLAATGQFIWYD